MSVPVSANNGAQMRCDRKSRGRQSILDRKTKFWLATDTVRQQCEWDADRVFSRAAERAGKKPSKMESDKAAYFASAHKNTYAAKNDLQKQYIHEQVEHRTHEYNNAHDIFNGIKIRPFKRNQKYRDTTNAYLRDKP